MTGVTTDRSSAPAATLPFDATLLDALLADAGIDRLVVTSPHNLRYLLGGYQYFLYALADPIGLDRYLGALVYRRGRPEDTVYIGAGNEAWGTEVADLWVPTIVERSWSAADTGRLVGEVLRAWDGTGDVGVELAYLPLAAAFGSGELIDASAVLERLRMIKSPAELALIRRSSNAVVDAILETMAATRVGDAKRAIVQRLARAETDRGLTFCYGLVAAGASIHRGPSAERIAFGDVLSIDSGATYSGYVADLARMAILGEPTERHEELLAQVDAVQQAARALGRPGTIGRALFVAADDVIATCPDGARMSFLAHGTGLVTHEAPRLTATGSPPYPAAHADRPLQEGMVVSIETHVTDPRIGFVKLEDTIIIGPDGPEPVADHGRAWTRVG